MRGIYRDVKSKSCDNTVICDLCLSLSITLSMLNKISSSAFLEYFHMEEFIIMINKYLNRIYDINNNI